MTEQSGGRWNHQFWMADFHGLVRIRQTDTELCNPEVWRDGNWRTGSPYVMDAITGMGEDPYSGGEIIKISKPTLSIHLGHTLKLLILTGFSPIVAFAANRPCVIDRCFMPRLCRRPIQSVTSSCRFEYCFADRNGLRAVFGRPAKRVKSVHAVIALDNIWADHYDEYLCPYQR